MKVYLETLGCQMNRLDSELVVGLLRAAGHEMVEDHRSANVVLYNTCSVRQHAEDKVYSRLGADAKRKSSGRKLIVGVLGCMAQREGLDLARRYRSVDVLCAPGQLQHLAELIEAAGGNSGNKTPAVALDPDRNVPEAAEALDALDLARDPRNTPTAAQAFVRVMRGCDKFCSYCIVPFVRGPERSRPPAAVAEEVKRLVDAGRTEITLIGQTVNSYRHVAPPTAGGATTRFSDLLQKLSPTPGLRRLRFVTSNPLDFTPDILEAMRDLPNVCPYIHCPAQSGADAILEKMNRKYTRAQYNELVDAARRIVPDVVMVSDFIVGFPGETEDDHAASVDLIRRSGFKNSFIFKYSPRPGTAAERRFEDDVPDSVKRRRNQELLAAQEEVGLAHHRAYVGRTMEVLVTGKSQRELRRTATVRQSSPQDASEQLGGMPIPQSGKACLSRSPAPAGSKRIQLQGRTRGDHIVVFDGPGSLAGRYVKVEITDATALTLFGNTSTSQPTVVR